MPVTSNRADPRDRLIFALDVPDATEARRVAGQLGDAVTFYKLGLELMTAGGYFELVDWLLSRNKRIFADLKLFDVPATVNRSIALLAKRGITFATVHGNQGIMEAAA
ncbi:MAG: orotidine-5'-phosphate decarboxylase, partial [Chromatiales bacterium]